MHKRMAWASGILLLTGLGLAGANLAGGSSEGSGEQMDWAIGTAPSVNRADLTPDESEVVVYGKVSMVLYIDLSDSDIRAIAKDHPKFFNKIGLMGWERKGTRFFRKAPATGIELRFEDQTARIQRGTYAILAEEGEGADLRNRLKERFEVKARGTAGEAPFELTTGGIAIPQHMIELSAFDPGIDESSALNADVTILVNYRELKAQMCHLPKKGEPQRVTGPMERCMDYNGPWSDGKNHPVTNPRAWVNFICSDCDLAGAGKCVSCWLDHVRGGCQKNHGKVCSHYIGHSSSYHKHKWSNCRYCL